MFSYIKSVLFGGEESPPRGYTHDPPRSGRKSSANGDSSARKQQLKATPIGSKRHMSETGRAQKHITAGVARQDEDCKQISLSLLFLNTEIETSRAPILLQNLSVQSREKAKPPVAPTRGITPRDHQQQLNSSVQYRLRRSDAMSVY